MKCLVLLLALATPLVSHAQTQEAFKPALIQAGDPADANPDDAAIRAVIESLFDGMRASDSSAVRAAFHPNATLQSVLPTGADAFQIQVSEIPMFIASVASSPVGALDEQIETTVVQLDAGLAHVWTEYTFTYQGAFSHCGVNSMQMVKTADSGWQILNIIDTRRRDCE